jgi:xanthine dehydrogenase/oxidase
MEGTLGSKATGEPSMLMGCSVLFAIRNAVQSARADCGIKGNVEEPNWVNLSGPVTVEKLQLATGITPEHFTL